MDPFGETVGVVYEGPPAILAVLPKHLVDQLFLSRGEFPASRITKQANLIILRGRNELPPDFHRVRRRLIPDQIIDPIDNRSVVRRDVTIGGNRSSPADESFAIRQVKKLDEFHIAHPATAKPQKAGSGLSRLGLIEQQLHPA